MDRKQIVEQLNMHRNSINALEGALRHMNNPFYNLLGHRCYISDCMGDVGSIIIADSMTPDEFMEMWKTLVKLVSGITITSYRGGVVKIDAAPLSFIATLPKWEVE